MTAYLKSLLKPNQSNMLYRKNDLSKIQNIKQSTAPNMQSGIEKKSDPNLHCQFSSGTTRHTYLLLAIVD